MEKKTINVNYSGSGIITLRGFSNAFLWIGAILAVISIVAAITANYEYKSEMQQLIYGIQGAIASFVIVLLGAMGKVIATIGENSLYQKHYLDYTAFLHDIEFTKTNSQ